MHFPAFLLGISLLITGCVSSSNHYSNTVESWKGANITSLTRTWGAPNTKIVNPNGESIYVYRTQGDTTTQASANASRTVRAATLTTKNSKPPKRKLSLTCLAIFEANAKGKITHTEVRGNDCYGSAAFANKMTNPSDKMNIN